MQVHDAVGVAGSPLTHPSGRAPLSVMDASRPIRPATFLSGPEAAATGHAQTPTDGRLSPSRTCGPTVEGAMAVPRGTHRSLEGPHEAVSTREATVIQEA